MAKKLDPVIAEVLKGFGFGADAAWDCHGTWVVYHRALEQIAAKAGISYREPTVLVAEKDSAAILVTGQLGDKTEWSIGEAVIGMNYKVTGKQAAYPFAMAEKRAKDRVILKLIGLHGLAYSEEEADDFKEQKNVAETPKEEGPDKATAYTDGAVAVINSYTGTGQELRDWWNQQAPKRRENNLGQIHVDILRGKLKERIEFLNSQVEEDAA